MLLNAANSPKRAPKTMRAPRLRATRRAARQEQSCRHRNAGRRARTRRSNPVTPRAAAVVGAHACAPADLHGGHSRLASAGGAKGARTTRIECAPTTGAPAEL